MNTPAKTGKHPKGLYILFFTEMWERFGYYLMVGILFLFLTKSSGKGLPNAFGADVVGTFIALVYLTPFIGGLLADRYLGYIKSIFIGGSLMAAGYLTIALPGEYTTYVAMGLIIIGNGFFKPNISTLLGIMYNREDLKPLKDNAYNIFYMGINIGAFFCNFAAAILRNKWEGIDGWRAAFSAGGIGLIIGLIALAINLKHIKPYDVKKPMQAGDMPTSRILGSVFIPMIIFGALGWFLPGKNHNIMGSHSTDAFIFACIPVIFFYVRLWTKGNAEDKKGIGALLFIFTVSIIFWTIYNQNSTGLTIWADSHTNREIPKSIAGPADAIYMLQTVSDTPRYTNKVDEHMVTLTDKDSIVRMDTITKIGIKDNKPDTSRIIHGITINGNRVDPDPDSRAIQVMGPDPYFNNVPKDKWPRSGETKVGNTELFQSINPFFIVALTPLLIMFFAWRSRRGKPVSTASKFAWALIISGLSALVMVLAVMSVPSIYTHKASPIWLFLTYGVFTVSEICLSPIGLSFVSKLAPPRLTALMMGGWFLSTSLGGKVAGVMASFWDKIPDKRIFFGIITIAAILGGLLIFSKVKSLNQIVKDKTGST
ncbi:MAG: peptide MFS transporter [Bacteroidetes bacterium]|jgi:POT family proton-dependent oligopeptide transporter|nr:MAG: peptide MFS transporter [Bacteroidota bacterium]